MAVSGTSITVGGYGAVFLTAEQQERFTTVKTKLCGHKAVDVADFEKNGMHSIVAAMERMKWTKIATLSEVSYPDLVKAFYVYLKAEEDGSLTSMVKGTQIRITYDLLESLVGVSTSDHSGVHTVDVQAKGLGIVGPEFRLKDGKLDINQVNTFNRILHFIVCQILVPRSATFSICTKADSDMMFWAIQNQTINMAEVILERMKFASAQIWDKKSKLNVSLPYAYLLTIIFQHYGISVVGAVSEKMGQAIRSRNLKKSGFSLVAGVWTKTSVAEGEAIIGEAQEVQEEAVPVIVAAAVLDAQIEQEDVRVEVPSIQEQQVQIPVVQEEAAQAEAVAAEPAVQQEVIREETSAVQEEHFAAAPVVQEEVRAKISSILEEQAADLQENEVEDSFMAPVGSSRRIEDILVENIEPVGDAVEEIVNPTSVVASILKNVLDSITSTQGRHEPKIVCEDVAVGHSEPPDGAEGRVVGHWQATTVDHPSIADGALGGCNTVTGSAERGLWASEPPVEKEAAIAGPSGPQVVEAKSAKIVEDSGPSGPNIVDEVAASRSANAELSGPSGPNIVEKVAAPRKAISLLQSAVAHTHSIAVDYATLEIPDVVFLPPIHSLVMESSMGTLIFERFERIMARVSIQLGKSLPFHRFVFREYYRGHIKSDILAPILSEWFWPKANLASTLGRLSGVSVQTWTPTLTPASSDMDANFSDLHALQSQKIREQGMASIGGMSPNGSQLVKSVW
ncbi:hypothetical protein Taro_042096 [Colocasia esculenta]|uniref:Putative plant transposon protein domain-containing protein n=1 Tax=Colocasia esculenta TaxID=4460 RepID=A0A843WFZ3_COLES|nr:hypothetical protein [Colocasia esculenta]